jgi:hypothetical protein
MVDRNNHAVMFLNILYTCGISSAARIRLSRTDSSLGLIPGPYGLCLTEVIVAKDSGKIRANALDTPQRNTGV